MLPNTPPSALAWAASPLVRRARSLALLVPFAGCSEPGSGNGQLPDATPDNALGDAPDAPDCVIQRPTALDGLMVRPPWSVAGVDYCVGYPTSTVLKDPMTLSIAGVSRNATTRVVTVTGNDVTLDGYDFSLDGGWNVGVEGANTRIINSKFVIGTNNNAPIIAAIASSNLYVGYSVIDGNGKDPGFGGLISNRGKGFTVEYCWLKNAGGDIIQQIDGGHDVVIRYNLIEQGGMAPGAHGDYTQLAGGPFVATIVYNTTIQSGGTTQGLMTEFVATGELGNNTMIGDVSYFVSVDLSSIATTFAVHDNYFAHPVFGFVYPNSGPDDASPKSTFTNNVNMVTGAIIQDGN